jgi:hypothetical protein
MAHAAGPPVQGNGIATAALVVGIVSIPALLACGLGGLSGVVAIVLGIVGISAANRSPDARGKGQAVTGVVTGALAVLLAIGFWAFVITVDVDEERFSDVGVDLDEFEDDPGSSEFDEFQEFQEYDGYCDPAQEWQDPDC